MDIRALHFPPDLPITAHRDEIAEALTKHPVIIVCGDTGSGKTTQLPKIALACGFGKKGRVACTQPRRLATLAMARRLAAELQTEPGGIVGYQHRFEQKISSKTVVKFMTDGILLAETRNDPLLRTYDCIMIDEAHERSLNIDFLLGLLKRIVAKRPQLRVIISSATIDAARFSEFFNDAPVIRVPGRLHPIETRWRPPDEDDADLPRLIANALDELPPNGDVLVFLPGERDIREAAEHLTAQRRDCDIIPLLASLPAAEQQRAFQTSSRQRVILATNVAETSITIPNIHCVIDSGLARISRYNTRTRVQRLHIEDISQASANQRQGRCGRVGPGICVRLYDETDFAKREAYTDPEIRRTSLSGVILTLLDLRLGNIVDFPFIDPPATATIRDGLRELHELCAIEPIGDAWRLTSLGHKLARLPVAPSLARILFAAHDHGALRDALIVVAANPPSRRSNILTTSR